jgi:DNA-binding NarL/FixJ family response regulator
VETDRQRRSVLLIEDHAMVREGLELLLGTVLPECSFTGASSFAEAIRVLASSAAPDWVLLDLGLPDIAGLDALSLLRRDHAHVPVVVLSSSEERELVLDCINRGAVGFIGKSSSGSDLSAALRHIFGGGVHLPPALFVGRPPAAPPAGKVLATRRDDLTRLGLTPRQIEVLELLVQGLSNKLIAERLQLSEATVKTHVAAGLRALNVKNRTQAVFALATWGYSTHGRGVTDG